MRFDLGIIPDDPAALRAAFIQADREADALITTGGVSVGEADFTKQLLDGSTLYLPLEDRERIRRPDRPADHRSSSRRRSHPCAGLFRTARPNCWMP